MKKDIFGKTAFDRFVKKIKSKIFTLKPPVHPERLLNPMFHGHRFGIECRAFDSVFSGILKFLGCSTVCVTAMNIFNGIKDSAAYLLKVEAARQALGRARDWQLMAWIAYWDGCPDDDQLRFVKGQLEHLEECREWQRKAREAYGNGTANDRQSEFVENQLEQLEDMTRISAERRSSALNQKLGIAVSTARVLRSTVLTFCPRCGVRKNTRGTVPTNENTMRKDRRETQVFVDVREPTGTPLKFTSGYRDVVDRTGMPAMALKRALATEGGGVVEVKQSGRAKPKGTIWYARYTPLPDRLCVIDRCWLCRDAGAPTMKLVDPSQQYRTTTLQTIKYRASRASAARKFPLGIVVKHKYHSSKLM